MDEEDQQSSWSGLHLSASEDESGGDKERENRKLLEAISSLGGKKRKKLGERSEANIQVSEFMVNAEGEGDKINLSDLIGTMEKTSTVATKTQKLLKTVQSGQTTLETPLSRQAMEKIHRAVAFNKTAKEVSRWQSIVTQNQRAEQLIFPLNQEPHGPKRVEQVVAGWKAQTPLEQEIFSLLHKNKQPIYNPVLTPRDEASMKAMSLEEAKIRRAELQKARALQSYYEAKSKREKKIKSKQYHRVQKKAKRKEFLKQFEEMCKTDPAAALEELNTFELSRMQERMSLKHQNSGKWAKSKAIMAKYDEGARKAMQQQLEVNKELTQKLVAPPDEEEGDGDEEDPRELPDFVNDAEPVLDNVNPWMRGKLSAEPTEQEADEATEVSPGETKQPQEEAEDEMEEEPEEEVLLREFEARRKLRKTEEPDIPRIVENNEETPEENRAESIEISDDDDDDEENLSEFTGLYQAIANSQQEPQAQAQAAQPESGPGGEGQGLLEEGLVRVRTLEDVELLSQYALPTDKPEPATPADQTPTTEETGAMKSSTEQEKRKKKRKKGIDPDEVLTKESKVIKVPMVPTAVEEEEALEMDEQRTIIKEAFAGDDVVSDFLKDKRKQEELARPKVVDLTLPGWGEWGGQGLQPSRRKRRRFRVKAALPPPRRDGKLPAIIFSEKRNSSVAMHQVSHLPFPFENPTQFERTMCTPIGHTWNTQQTVKKITAPKVITRLGAIIDPMTHEELTKNKKKSLPQNGPNILLDSGKNGGTKRKHEKQSPSHKTHKK